MDTTYLLSQTISAYPYLLGLSLIVFGFLQFRAPKFVFRNVLAALSAPGALAGICVYLLVAIQALTVSVWSIVPVFAVFSLFFPAFWVMPITLAISVRQTSNTRSANIAFALASAVIVGLYFFTYAIGQMDMSSGA